MICPSGAYKHWSVFTAVAADYIVILVCALQEGGAAYAGSAPSSALRVRRHIAAFVEETENMARSATPPGEQEGPDIPVQSRVASGDDSGAQDMDEHGMQHGGGRGRARDEALKRITRSHPRRDIPRIESMDPLHAPAKE